MNIIGTIAAGLFVLLGVILLAPLFFTRAVKDTYEKFNFWEFMHDLPNWASYLVVLALSFATWWALFALVFILVE
jgi:uncharacterized membrane protein YbhN (UPF0104 family)